MPPDDASHGGVVCRDIDVDAVSGEDPDLPAPLHAAGSPGSNFETTLDLDDEGRIAV
jgi:hypothetical protein